MTALTDARARAPERWLRALIKGAASLSTVMTVVLMLLIVANVALRTLAGGSVRGVVELSTTAIVFVVFLSLAEAQRQGEHVGVNLFTDMLPRGVQQVLRRAVLGGAAVFFGWMTWESWVLTRGSLERGEVHFGILRFPVWPARLAIVAGLALLVAELARQAVRGEQAARDQPR
jgi:TRAP-type C4-dicarboxylate transport system permease small subunit